MHDACMATKTISLELDAYDRLKRAKRSPRESFSEVVRRARWDDLEPATGTELMARLIRLHRERPEAYLSEQALDRIEQRAEQRIARTRPRAR